MQTTKARFEIWENKKRTIIVNANLLLKYTAVEVEGEKVISESHFSSLPKKFRFEVIDTEKNDSHAKWKYLNLDIKNGGERND